MTGQSMRVTLSELHTMGHTLSHVGRLVKTVSQASVFQQLTPSTGMLTRVDRHLSSKSNVWISEPNI